MHPLRTHSSKNQCISTSAVGQAHSLCFLSIFWKEVRSINPAMFYAEVIWLTDSPFQMQLVISSKKHWVFDRWFWCGACLCLQNVANGSINLGEWNRRSLHLALIPLCLSYCLKFMPKIVMPLLMICSLRLRLSNMALLFICITFISVPFWVICRVSNCWSSNHREIDRLAL